MAQFKRNNKKSFLSKITKYYYQSKIGASGPSTDFDSFVYLMRFPKNIFLGDGAYIKGNARICPCNPDATITIGANTTVGYNTIIFSSKKITIGHDCMIAPNVYIVDSDHGMDRSMLMNAQENVTDEVVIENDVWLGTGAVILKGTYIPEGCVIAANSVVKGTLEPYTIYGGVPARKIGERK
ncbi:hypothetical protein tloyanaT_29000 [Thalassotalea loyana]|uniref:Acyltransferase n=1 Tax=Thalassotalea loyana TaxID=280483 RepID=A0ABQ6HGB7_9GAMM|nr:acyltransferase [Thalassotalea loyana]GLX86647.1 hypothetical protein tloyanaT_29000 [Thalassotalea loyana]